MRALFIACLCFSAAWATATDLWVEGFVDTYAASRLDNGEWNALRTRLRTSISASQGEAYLFASVNAEENRIVEEKDGVALHEAYAEYAGDGWDVRVGRQIVSWGKADGMQITDIICPGDYTEYITRDFDDIRMPIDAVLWRWLPLWGAFELLWSPVFEPAVAPPAESPWAFAAPEAETPATPESKLENSEIAGKLSVYTSGYDAAVSGFYTWDDNPAYHLDTSGESDVWRPRYHRLTYVGIELSKPVGEVVLRSEAAFFPDRVFADSEAADRTVEKGQLKMMLGADWTPNADWSVSGQIADDWIVEHNASQQDDEHTGVATLRVSRKFLRETLEISNMLYVGLNDNDAYDQIKVDYALTDGLHALVGADVFAGDDDTRFGRFDDNTQAWTKLKYSF